MAALRAPRAGARREAWTRPRRRPRRAATRAGRPAVTQEVSYTALRKVCPAALRGPAAPRAPARQRRGRRAVGLVCGRAPRASVGRAGAAWGGKAKAVARGGVRGCRRLVPGARRGDLLDRHHGDRRLLGGYLEIGAAECSTQAQQRARRAREAKKETRRGVSGGESLIAGRRARPAVAPIFPGLAISPVSWMCHSTPGRRDAAARRPVAPSPPHTHRRCVVGGKSWVSNCAPLVGFLATLGAKNRDMHRYTRV